MKHRFNRHQRSTARLGIVQLLFVQQTGERALTPDELLMFFDEDWAKPDMRFLQERLQSVSNNRIALDEVIDSGLKSNWSRDRIDPVLYAILLASTDELLYGSTTTPHEIIVKEYADLTADFFDSSETSFVNAYLNSLKLKALTEKS